MPIMINRPSPSVHTPSAGNRKAYSPVDRQKLAIMSSIGGMDCNPAPVVCPAATPGAPANSSRRTTAPVRIPVLFIVVFISFRSAGQERTTRTWPELTVCPLVTSTDWTTPFPGA